MAAIQCIERLGGWEGYELQEQQVESRGGVRWCVLRLSPKQGVRRCGGPWGRHVEFMEQLIPLAAVHEFGNLSAVPAPWNPHLVDCLARVRAARHMECRTPTSPRRVFGRSY